MMYCPYCKTLGECKRIGDVPYARTAVYSRHFLTCPKCKGVFDIFTTNRPKN